MNVQIRYLTAADVKAVGLDMAQAVECVEQVLSLHSRGLVNLPSKVVLDMDERRHGRVNAMPAYVGAPVHACGIKWIAGFPNNPTRHNLPRAHALIVLNDPETGLPLAIMEGTRISALRTGAVTGVGARYLARQDSRVAGLIGAGVQAWTQLEALKLILPQLDRVRVFDIRTKASSDFVHRARERYEGLSAEVVAGPEDAARGADVLVTATVADEPIVKADWLDPGVFFAHVGSYQEEEEAVILQADRVVVDIWEEVLHRRTPLLARMFEEGRIDASRIDANIGEIINGDKPGRQREDERIYFSPLGLGSEDIAVAAWVYRTALEMDMGVSLPFGQTTHP